MEINEFDLNKMSKKELVDEVFKAYNLGKT